MPTYDFVCLDCRKRFDIFLSYQEYGTKAVACAHCSSANVRRRVPRVRVLKSDEQRLSALGDPSMLDGIDDDPVALGRMMRKMGSELGEGLPPEFSDVVDRLEAGQSPEEIESAIPDLAEGLGGGDMGDMGGFDD
ncbi:MAG: zinc ribbon domain-containing protein [Chloroflexi bacterium HGW-Chloroflexi-6]|jgi:putative FmdB family regulatory protein|nr:MAG: zinc ribbon domain-containing protein [Chloroflexi bacterium HGW-Chloroflexi-6]